MAGVAWLESPFRLALTWIVTVVVKRSPLELRELLSVVVAGLLRLVAERGRSDRA